MLLRLTRSRSRLGAINFRGLAYTKVSHAPYSLDKMWLVKVRVGEVRDPSIKQGTAVRGVQDQLLNKTDLFGGEDADITELPYQLSLQNHGNHICGASVLSVSRALTAAHCTYGASASSLSVRAGSTYRGSGGQVVQVSRVSQNPNYNHQTTDYDVSVLILAFPLSLGSGVQPIALRPVGQELADGDLAVGSGWGVLSSNGPLPVILQKVQLPKVSDASCKNAYGQGAITARMTCYGYEQGGKDSCQGDSGGPLVVGGRQVGVVLWGRGCAAAGYSGVYAKVSNAEIQSHISNSL